MDNHTIPKVIRDDYEEAVALRDSGLYESALQILLRLLDSFPSHPRILNMTGVIYYRGFRDYNNAEKYFLKTLNAAPDYYRASSNLCGVYSKLRHFDKAREYARRAIEANPKCPNAWNNLGLIYARTGKIVTALDYFKAAYAIDRECLTAAYNIACAMLELGQIDDAIHYAEIFFQDIDCYRNYTRSSDFDSIKDNPIFRSVVKSAKDRFENLLTSNPDIKYNPKHSEGEGVNGNQVVFE